MKAIPGAIAAFLVVCVWMPALAKPQMADRIVAVVDDQIVLHSDVMSQIAFEAMRMGLSRRELTEDRVRGLYGKILENMVQDLSDGHLFLPSSELGQVLLLEPTLRSCPFQ